MGVILFIRTLSPSDQEVGGFQASGMKATKKHGQVLFPAGYGRGGFDLGGGIRPIVKALPFRFQGAIQILQGPDFLFQLEGSKKIQQPGQEKSHKKKKEGRKVEGQGNGLQADDSQIQMQRVVGG
jgi:hypothetical protein